MVLHLYTWPTAPTGKTSIAIVYTRTLQPLITKKRL